MSSKIQVKPEVNRLINFIADIEHGKFKIPTFQRDFVWEKSDKIELFDSISKEYPIGSILLWQPSYNFKNRESIGPYIIDNSRNKEFFYVLDGFQRLSTLFGCLTNPNKTELKYDDNKLKKEYSLFYDLEEESFHMNISKSITNIPVNILIDTYAFLDYLDALRTEVNDPEKAKLFIERAKKLSSTIIDYSIPSIQIFGGSIKEAVDIFSRINSKGISISQDWMLSALTSSDDDGFNLGEILGSLLNDLKEYNFHDLKRDVLVQCIQTSFGKIYFDQRIEDLATRPEFKTVTYKTIISIKKAIKFLFEELLITQRKLLPYNNQLIFITYFFNEIDQPNSFQISKLKKWFWVSTYSNYFTIYSLSKIRQAFEQFNRFVKDENENPIFSDRINSKFTTTELPKSVSAKSVRSTAFILFLLNHSNEFIRIDAIDLNSTRISYLVKNNTSHANAIPILEFVNSNNGSLPFDLRKSLDMSYLLSLDNFNEFASKYFLNSNIINLYNSNNIDEMLIERMSLIRTAEKRFVESLDIVYS